MATKAKQVFGLRKLGFSLLLLLAVNPGFGQSAEDPW